MLAIIVDKVEKRKNIALSCKDLFIKNSIKDLTITKIAQTAGIGKGSVYDYFKNKDEIVFELINILMIEHDEKKIIEISKIESTKEKVKLFVDFFYSKEDYELREIYKSFMAISFSTPSSNIIEFQTKCHDFYCLWFENIIQEAIDKGELIQEAVLISKSIISTAKGLFLTSLSTTLIKDLEYEINSYIDIIFTLMEKKNEI